MKKYLKLLLCLFLIITITACKTKEENKEEKTTKEVSVETVMDKIYEGVEDKPNLIEIEINDDNIEYYLGIKDVKYKKAIASEPAMGSIAWSVVAIELDSSEDVSKVKKEIKENIDPAKWICVDAEEVSIENIGNTILLVMMDELNADASKTIINNFNNLK